MALFKPFSGVYLFLKRKNKILLFRRNNMRWMSGMYSAISGFIEGNESITSAMVREAKEEADIEVKKSEINIFHIQHRKSDDVEFIDFYAFSENWIGTPIINETNKCDDLKWCPINILPHNTVPHLRSIINNWENKISISEVGF